MSQAFGVTRHQRTGETTLESSPMLTAEIVTPDASDAQDPALRDLGALLSTALDAAGTGFAIVDARAAHFPLLYVNAEFESLTGFKRAELLGRDFLTLFNSDSLDVAIEKMRAAFSKREEFTGEFLATRTDGKTFWNYIKVRLCREHQGAPKYFIVTQEDITERRRVRDRLRASEARLELAMSASELAMWDWNIATGEVYYNNQWQALLELPPEELLLRESLAGRLVLPQDDPSIFAELERHLKGEIGRFEREYAVRTASGRTKWVSARANVVQRDAQGRALRVIGVLRDISSRRESLHEVEEANKRWERAVAGTSDGLFDWDLETGYVWYAPRFREMLGYDERKSEQEFNNTFAAFQRVLHADDRLDVLTRIRNHLEQRTPLELRCRLANRSGAYRWFRLRGNAERDAAGRPRRLSGSIRDIDNQIGAEQAMRRSEEFYSTILDSLPLTVAYVNGDERIVYANRACGVLFARNADDFRGKLIRDVLTPELYAQLAESIALAFRGQHVEGQIQTPDAQGQPMDIDITYLPHSDDRREVQGCFVVARNVTKRLRLEAELRQSQKMEAIGRLTGGVAHDFNNLLSVVIGNAQLLTRTLKESPRLHKQADTVLRAAMRGAELTRRLLSFARQQSATQQVVQVNSLLSGMYELLRRTLPSDIDLRLDLGDEMYHTKLDAGQFENALLNLVINARDAMARGGAIVISSQNRALSKADVADAPPPGDYAVVTVSDNGSGMSDEVAKRAFEPFFTTKESGKGSGLGLAMVYGFVKQSGGFVSIESHLGVGTRVHLFFPRSREMVVRPDEPAVNFAELPRGSETILVVDDNPDVRATAVEMLSSLGYRVFAAGAGSEALQIAADHEVELLFSDLMLPGGMSSVALLRQLRLGHPRIKELFTSGFSESMIAHRSLVDGSIDVMPKPYQLSDLARRVRAVLDSTVEDQHRVQR
jgi:PAS domain S-box-containing protein